MRIAILGVAACAALFPARGAAAPAAAPGFPVALYPQLKDKSESDIRLAGVAALCPGRLLRGDPAPVAAPVPESRRTREAELPRGGAYLRLYAPDATTVRERATKSDLVVDCRYLRTDPADVAGVAALADALSGGAGPGWSFTGDYPVCAGEPSARAESPGLPRFSVLVLVNAGTSGPLEAALASLQARGFIHLVGGRTAGRTCAYAPLAEHPGWWGIAGEVAPAGGPSLVGAGVAPKFPVNVAPEDEFLAWQVVERGSPLGQVLPKETQGRTVAANGDAALAAPAKPVNGADKPVEITDATLSRAQDVLVALRVLGHR